MEFDQILEGKQVKDMQFWKSSSGFRMPLGQSLGK